MHAELFFGLERNQNAERDKTARRRRQPRSAPYLAPGVSSDEILEIAREIVRIGDRAVYVLVAQHGTAFVHALSMTIFVVHDRPKKLVTARVKASGSSTGDKCEPGMSTRSDPWIAAAM